MSNFHISILTLFPEMFPGSLSFSLAGKALKNNIWSYDITNIRDFGLTKHKNVDAKPFGGGSGLIMRPDVLGRALDKVLLRYPDTTIYYPSPKGVVFNQKFAHKLSRQKKIIILSGRFEGIDERIIDEYNIKQISIGDYILSGGEVAANVILDSVIRLLPGVVINQDTLREESFEKENLGTKLLEYPLYTKPSIWRNREVPKVLLTGNHYNIDKWKLNQSIQITKKLRPDLLK